MKKLILILSTAAAWSPAAPAGAGERIFLNPDGSVVDPSCKYVIADLLAAREHGEISGGALSNRAINIHTDVCNAQRSSRMRSSQDQYESWNRTTDAIEQDAARKRADERAAREAQQRMRESESRAISDRAWGSYLDRRR